VPITSPNYIINGAFDINQRNFTSTTALNAYGFDRWADGFQGGTVTYSAQTFAPGTAPASAVEGRNYARLTTASQSASGDYAVLIQKIEDVRTLAGQPITISLWARAASGTPKIAVELFQGFGSGGSASPPVFAFAGEAILSTSWVRYSFTVNVPSVVGKTLGTNQDSSLGVQFWTSGGSNYASRGINIGIQNTTVDFWGVQVEAGTVPTEFRRNASSIAEELAACQRYYQRINQTEYESPFGFGIQTSTTSSSLFVPLPTALRVKPISVTFSEVQVGDKSTVSLGGTIVSSNVSTTVALSLLVSHGVFGAQFRPAYLQGKGTAPFNSFIEINAEL
jgi:hypothetical protein